MADETDAEGVDAAAAVPAAAAPVDHAGRVAMQRADGHVFYASSLARGLAIDPSATPVDAAPKAEFAAQRAHEAEIEDQSGAGGMATIAAKEAASHAIDITTGIVRYPMMATAALTGNEAMSKVVQESGGQKILENLYSVYKDLQGDTTGEAAGRDYQRTTALQHEANPVTSAVSGIAGDVAGAVATGGLSVLAEGAGGLLSERLAGAAVGRLGAGATATKVGTEAFAQALQGAGLGMQGASEDAYLDNTPLTRSKIIAGGGLGGLFGGVVGGGVALLGGGAASALGKIAKPVEDAAPASSLAEALAGSTVSEQAAKDIVGRVVTEPSPNLWSKYHGLMTDIESRVTGGDKELTRKFGLGAVLDPSTRAEAMSGYAMLADRDAIVAKASGEITDSMGVLNKNGREGAFHEVQDLGMKRDAWEKLVDPAKRGEQVDSAKAFLADTRAKLESMLEGPAKGHEAVHEYDVNVGALDHSSMRPEPVPPGGNGSVPGVEPEAGDISQKDPISLDDSGHAHEVTLYRATDRTGDIASGSFFSPNEESARAYQDNPGFGGKTLIAVPFKVDKDRILSLVKGRLNGLPHGEQAPDAWDTLAELLDTDRRELKDNYANIHDVLDSPNDRRKLAEHGYDFAVLEDTYPEKAVSWAYLGDKRALTDAAKPATKLDYDVNVGTFDHSSMRPESAEWLAAHPGEGDAHGLPRIEHYPDGVSLTDGRHRLTEAAMRGDPTARANVVHYDAEGNKLSEAEHEVSLSNTPGDPRNAVTQRTPSPGVDAAEFDLGPTYGGEKNIKALINHVKKAEKALGRDAVTGADAAIELDGLKRIMGKQQAKLRTRFQKLSSDGEFGSDAVAQTFHVVNDARESLRSHLENQDLWGTAGAAQHDINTGWVTYLNSEHLYNQRLFTNTGSSADRFADIHNRGRWEVDPDKVNSWMQTFGTQKGKLNDGYIRAHVEAIDNLTSQIGKYVDTGKVGAQVQSVRDAALHIKSQLGVADRTIATANQLRELGASQAGKGMGMGGLARTAAVVGGFAGGAPGAIAGAALGFLSNPARVGHVAMTLQGLASKVDGQIGEHVASLFSPVAAIKATGRVVSKAAKLTAVPAAVELSRTYEKRRAQLAALTSSPQLLAQQTARSLGPLATMAPKAAASYAQDAARLVHTAQAMAPAATKVGGAFAAHRKGFTPPADMQRFNDQFEGMFNPLSVLRDIKRGVISLPKVEAARNAHPELFADITGRLIQHMAEHPEAKMSPQAARQADILFGMNGAGDATVEPGFLQRLAMLQSKDAADAASPPAARPPVNIAKGAKTLSQSLEDPQS